LRGALATLTASPRDTLEQGIVTASSGNHGAAVACAAKERLVLARVFVPSTASPVKVTAI
jgi:threonine dehydratase